MPTCLPDDMLEQPTSLKGHVHEPTRDPLTPALQTLRKKIHFNRKFNSVNPVSPGLVYIYYSCRLASPGKIFLMHFSDFTNLVVNHLSSSLRDGRQEIKRKRENTSQHISCVTAVVLLWSQETLLFFTVALLTVQTKPSLDVNANPESVPG